MTSASSSKTVAIHCLALPRRDGHAYGEDITSAAGVVESNSSRLLRADIANPSRWPSAGLELRGRLESNHVLQEGSTPPRTTAADNAEGDR